MAKNLLFSPLFSFHILFFLLTLLSQSCAQTPTPIPPPPSKLCKSTPYPSYCSSVLPTTNSSSTVYDYGRFSVRKSLSVARKFLALITNHLRKSKDLTLTATRALEDCEYLAQCSIDNLMSSLQIVNKTSQTLTASRAENVQTLLSAILTNTQTCIDSLQEAAASWSVRNGILTPLPNDTRLYSVSLALFTKGWVPQARKGKVAVHNNPTARKHLMRNGKLNLKMSDRNRDIYRTVNGNRRLLEADNADGQVPQERKGKVAAHNNPRDIYRTVNGNRRLLQADNVDGQVEVSGIVVVSQDGSWNFTTITDAVNAAPNNTDGSNGYFLIYITAGVYEEYVSIAKNKRHLMMVGAGINETIITGNHSVIDGWTTFNSPTFAVVAPNFFAVGITFRNTAGPAKHQAVAVRNGGDLSTFYSCSFEAYQDTLYVHSLRQFYLECDVYGTVDFIFGNAAAVFQSCNLYPRLPMAGQFNAITAQGRTDPNQNTGITVQNCTIRAADDLAGGNMTVKTYLGRPWKEYSRAVYMQSFMGGLIEPVGWSVWSGDFALNTSYYAEFGNTGPGSDTGRRVTWPGFHVIGANEAGNFTVAAFLAGDDWIPETGVTYTSGLL